MPYIPERKYLPPKVIKMPITPLKIGWPVEPHPFALPELGMSFTSERTSPTIYGILARCYISYVQSQVSKVPRDSLRNQASLLFVVPFASGTASK
jgi:hypothetical protein